jgi:hypothetical protein
MPDAAPVISAVSPSSSLLKNEEKYRVFLFLPESGLGAMVCDCEGTLAYAATSLGIRIKL